MNNYIAERQLLFSEKNSSGIKRMRVRVSVPTIVEEGTAEFPVNGVVAVCHVELDGLDEHSFDVYGMDSLQAINLASDIESVLKRLSAKYDFFWSTREPYFDGDDN